MVRKSSPSRYFSMQTRLGGGPKTHTVSIRLSDDLIRSLAEVGNEEGLAMSDTIRLVLERGLEAGKSGRNKP